MRLTFEQMQQALTDLQKAWNEEAAKQLAVADTPGYPEPHASKHRARGQQLAECAGMLAYVLRR